MKKRVIAGAIFILIIIAVVIWSTTLKRTNIISPLGRPLFEKPLDKYTIENLRKRGGIPSKITFSGNKFYYSSDGRKISGIVNGATESAAIIKPAILMLHGSADQGEYFPGFGTQKVAEVLAKNGFVTFAPDFLGYGESDKAPSDDFENRFLTYTTNMDLIESICKLQIGNCKLALWGHSNGGQIALSILAIMGKEIPTVLWNPVTKPFPYNILYFTDGYKDEGKWLRGALANFEKDYDVNKYSFDKYLDNIKAPIFLQQGEADEWVPVRWNRDFNLPAPVGQVKFKYKEYIGADHNMMPLWNQAVADTLKFFSVYTEN